MSRLHLIALLLSSLAALPCAALAENEPNGGDTTGIKGAISVSPARGGPLRANEPDSKPLAAIGFIVVKDGKTVASFDTDAAGKFQVALPPGHYTVQRAEAQSRIGRYGPFEVDVAEGKLTQVAWQCDSGMR